MSVYDTREIGKVKIVMLAGSGGGGSSDAYALAGIGKEVSYSNQTITTDIELFRAPKVGDRFLIYFPDSCTNPRSLVINVNGVATTLSWEIVGGDTYKGLCAIEIKAGMLSAMALKKVWLEDELSAGTGISIVNNAITNTMPQLGENVGSRTYTTAITDGDLGNVTLSDDYVILNFKAAAQPDSTTGKYTIMEAASSYHLYAALVDMAGNDYTAEIPAGTTLICKNKDGGDGTSADPYKITVLGIGSGGGGGDTSIVRYNIVTTSTGGQDASITVNKYVNNTLKSTTLYLYSDLENTVTIDDLFTLNYGNAYLSYTYTLLNASTTHSAGYAYSWAYNQTVDFEDTFVVENIVPINRGGTGNADGYIRTGAASGSTIGNYATAEGYNVTASGNYSHAQNQNTTASGAGSNATGGFTTASNSYSTAMGYQTTASGERSVAEGTYTGATGKNAHAQGSSTSAIAENSFTCGEATQAGYKNQFVVGKLNNNKSTNIFEVGNGYAESSGGSYTPHPSNALEVDSLGNVTAGGDITDGQGNVLADKTDTSVVGPVESGTTASQAYAVGEHFIRNDKFCTCISAIASGATLTLNTNYVEGTIAEAIEDLTSYLEQTVTLSTSAETTATFTNAKITTSSVIDIAVSEWGLTPEDVTVTTGVCTVTMPKVSTARSITVRIYVR